MVVYTVIGIILMVASQATAWYLLSHDFRYPLFRSVCGLATFYTVWALYLKFFGGRPGELGVYTFGALAICSFFQQRILSLIAAVVVCLNFALGIFLSSSLGAEGFASAVGKDSDPSALVATWYFIFELYLVSSLLFWGWTSVKLYQMPSIAPSYQQIL